MTSAFCEKIFSNKNSKITKIINFYIDKEKKYMCILIICYLIYCEKIKKENSSKKDIFEKIMTIYNKCQLFDFVFDDLELNFKAIKKIKENNCLFDYYEFNQISEWDKMELVENDLYKKYLGY